MWLVVVGSDGAVLVGGLVDVAGRLVSGFLPTHGFTAILIALVAGLSITGTAIVSLFFGGLAALCLPTGKRPLTGMIASIAAAKE